MFHNAVPLWEIAARSALIYCAIVIGLRLFGKREIGQFTIFDLVLVLLIANAVQPAMTGPDFSATGGLVIILVLLALNLLVALIRLKVPFARKLLEGTPTIIARDGAWIDAAMDRSGVIMDDAMMALREHGIDKIDDVLLAVLETDGSISVVPTEATLLRGKRKVRYRRRV
jgi:uncharacterized membrane protein YcaP (DUF421 family)